MRCSASIVLDDIDPDALVDVPPDTLIAGVSRLKQAMNAAIDFLDSEIRIKNIVFVPFPIMLVPHSLAGFGTAHSRKDTGRERTPSWRRT